MKTDQIKKRNMVMQVVLMIITLGIYAIYWYYSTLKELHVANGIYARDYILRPPEIVEVLDRLPDLLNWSIDHCRVVTTSHFYLLLSRGWD